jgi:hypothetical protein
MMSRTPLPPAIIPFILANLDAFDVSLENGERIIITPKDGAVVAPGSPVSVSLPPAYDRARPFLAPKPILRPKFIYRVKDRKLTPEQAKKFGFSAPRLAVYQAIWDAPKGITSKELMARTGLVHGAVQQILHWLRKQNMVKGEPET